MARPSGVDLDSLAWVRHELEETLSQAQQALNHYAANPEDQAQLRFLVTHLHQIYGTLRMLGVDGPTRLAQEMEEAAKALLDEAAPRDGDESNEVLMGALIQLPDYLERLQLGHPDNPAVLLPLLNQLRQLRGQTPLSEAAMRLPDLDFELAGGTVTVASPEDAEAVKALARELRPVYQDGLLRWYRGREPKRGLRQMARAVDRLEEAAHQEPVNRFWWIVSGVLEALLEDGLDSTAQPELGRLLGGVEQVIKRLVEHGELELLEEPPNELGRELLHCIARSRSEGPRVLAIRHAFRLDERFPERDDHVSPDAATQVSPALLANVATALRDDLASVKGALDAFARSEADRDGILPRVTATLRTVASTLSILGHDTLRGRLEAHVDALSAMVEGDQACDEESLAAILRGLLDVESALSGIAQEGAIAGGGGGTDSDLAIDADEEVSGAVFQEVATDMASMKTALEAAVEGRADSEPLDALPDTLRRIRGALVVYGLERAGAVATALARCIEQRLVPEDGRDAATVEMVADVIASLEFYLEALARNRANREPFLALAESSLAALGYPVDGAAEAPTPWPEDRDADAGGGFNGDGDPFDTSATGVDGAAPAAPASEPEPEPEPEPEALGIPDTTGMTVAPQWAPPADDLADPEITAIFAEEAEELLEAIHDAHRRWRAEPSDEETLRELRRSFHTLKGSGRLVGAYTIGELAWSVEDMLNRLLDGNREVGDDIWGVLDDVRAALPELVGRLRGEETAVIDVASLRARAAAAADGKPPAVATGDQPDATGAVADTGSEGGAKPSRPIDDPVLAQIFQVECAGHLNAVREHLDGCRQSSAPCHATEDLVRSLHTLQGSARMAEVNGVAAVSGLLESYAKAIWATGSHLTEEGMAALEAGIDAVEQMVAALGAQEAPDPALLRWLESLAASVEGEADGDQRLWGVTDTAPREGAPAVAPERDNGAATAAGMAAGPGEGDAAASEPAADASAGPDDEAAGEESVEVFLEEAPELLEEAESILAHWRQAPEDTQAVGGLHRTLHTLKGSARVVGLRSIGDLSHALESVLAAVNDGYIPVSPRLFEVLELAFDRLSRIEEALRQRAPQPPVHDLYTLFRELHAEVTDEVFPEPPEPAVFSVDGHEPDASRAEAEAPVEPGGMRERRQRSRVQHEMTRVRADLLNHLVNFAGEISIYGSRLSQQMGSYRFNLTELDQTVMRLRNQLRKLEIETESQILFRYERDGNTVHREFDPLELDRFSQLQEMSRSLAESLGDLVSLKGLLENLTRESETLLLQQSRLTTELQEGLMRTRMVPFANLLQRLRRVVRQTCQDLDKRAELRVAGAEGEMDRMMLERIAAPMGHLLSNAVAHGIEEPAARRDAGKAETGLIHLNVSREGSEVVIRVTDDGAGVDLDAVRRRAREAGLVSADTQLSDHDVMQFILQTGFSTAGELTQISGRGVGLDVVNSELKQLGGTLTIETERNRGSTFTIRLPFTLAVHRALMVRCAGDQYAIPLQSIEGVVRVSPDDVVANADGQPTITYSGHSYPILPLGQLLWPEAETPRAEGAHVPVLLVRSGDRRGAVEVESLMGSREVVVKSVGPQISSIPGIYGATILEDGQVALILDLMTLVRGGTTRPLTMEPAAAGATADAEREAPAAAQAPVTAMVVDDSITMRKVTARLLERNAMRVVTAKDGVDAVGQLHHELPDVMLLDIEMPRMDGYELAQHMRNDARLSTVPIVMITTRSGDKHRRRAEDLGIERYLSKPYQESELLDSIRELVGERRVDG